MNIPSRLPHTVGVIPDMCDNERVVVLRVPGKIAKECTIEDAGSGEPVLRVVGKAVSWSGQKRITTAQGTPLFDLSQEHFHLHKTFFARAPGMKLDSPPLFSIRQKHFNKRDKMGVIYTNPVTGHPEELLVRAGDWKGHSAIITLGGADGPVVATLARETNVHSTSPASSPSPASPTSPATPHPRLLTMAPGADVAMMAALCICWDELSQKDSAGAGDAATGDDAGNINEAGLVRNEVSSDTKASGAGTAGNSG